MSLSTQCEQLVESLAKPRAVAAFRAAGQRQVVLGLFPTPASAIDELLGLKIAGDKYNGRGADALLRAVLFEYQAGTVDVWPAMLLVSFHPALMWLRKRVKTDRLADDEVSALVVESFLAGAHGLPRLHDVDRVPMHLRQEAERRTFHALKASRADARLTRNFVADAKARGRIEPFRGGRLEAQPHPIDAIVSDEMLQALAADAPEVIALLKSGVRSLRGLTVAMCPELSRIEQERLYQCVKRRYARERARGDSADSHPPWWRVLIDLKENRRRRAS